MNHERTGARYSCGTHTSKDPIVCGPTGPSLTSKVVSPDLLMVGLAYLI
jgi:hypothetical protein